MAAVGNQQGYLPFGNNPGSGPSNYQLYEDEWIAQCADPAVRAGFIRKVYGILSAQLLFTTILAAPFATHMISEEWCLDNQGLMVMSSIAALAVICIGACKPDMFRTYPTNYIVLGVFTFFQSITVGFATSLYSTSSVLGAFLITMGIFLGLTAYAFTTKRDFTGMGAYLFAALLGMCITGLVFLFILPGNVATMIYSGCGAILFSFYIVYDTQLMLGGDHAIKFAVDDYVYAVLNLYLDILNLFLDILRLMGERNN